MRRRRGNVELDVTCSICFSVVRKAYLNRHQKNSPECRIARSRKELQSEGWCNVSGLITKRDLDEHGIPTRYEPTTHYRSGWGTPSSTTFNLYAPAWFNCLFQLTEQKSWGATEIEDESFWAEAEKAVKDVRLQCLLIWEAAMASEIVFKEDGSDPYSAWLRKHELQSCASAQG